MSAYSDVDLALGAIVFVIVCVLACAAMLILYPDDDIDL